MQNLEYLYYRIIDISNISSQTVRHIGIKFYSKIKNFSTQVRNEIEKKDRMKKKCLVIFITFTSISEQRCVPSL